MGRYHIDKEVQSLVGELCLLPEYKSNSDFYVLCGNLVSELRTRDFSSAASKYEF